MSAYVIGLTGGIACGKSNISAALTRAGAEVADADKIAHSVTAAGGAALPIIRSVFGDDVFFADGTLNRAALASVVFADEEKRKALNAIIHPAVIQEIRDRIDRARDIIVLDVPLLYECGLETLCDEVWCVYLPQSLQLKRLRERDHITYKAALQRIRSQMSTREKAKRSQFVIRTDGTTEESAKKALDRYDTIRQRIKNEHILQLKEG